MQFEHAWCHMVSKTLFLSQELVFQLYSQTGQKDTHFTISNKKTGCVAQWSRTCLASTRPQVQPPVPNKQAKKEWEGFGGQTTDTSPVDIVLVSYFFSKASPLILVDFFFCCCFVFCLFPNLTTFPHFCPGLSSFERVLI